MGYTTDFYGSFQLDKPLSPEQVAYINKFNETRRMARDTAMLESEPDPTRLAVGLPLGPEGAYFVGAEGNYGQGDHHSILNYNVPPSGQPGLWCQWRASGDGTRIEWDEGEKFYCYVQWLEYLILHFLEPWGYVLKGKVTWEGEEHTDMGIIVVEDNAVSTKRAKITYE